MPKSALESILSEEPSSTSESMLSEAPKSILETGLDSRLSERLLRTSSLDALAVFNPIKRKSITNNKVNPIILLLFIKHLQ